jgi:uncharacterized protein YjiS (DUF1127 family)
MARTNRLAAHRPNACRNARSLVATSLNLLHRLVEHYAAYAERRQQRRALSRLDHRLLDDIGLTPSDAMREADKPFWK